MYISTEKPMFSAAPSADDYIHDTIGYDHTMRQETSNMRTCRKLLTGNQVSPLIGNVTEK